MFKLISARSLAVTVLSFVAVSLAVLWPNWRNELMAVGYGDVYHLVGQAASCSYSVETQLEDGTWTLLDFDIEIGQGQVANPPQDRQNLVLASVYIFEARCPPEGDCYFTDYNSGEIPMPPEAITFGKKLQSATFKAVVDVYSWEYPDTPIAVNLDLTWMPTGERAYRIKDVYHRTTPSSMILERVNEMAYPANVFGTIGFRDTDYDLGPDSWSMGRLYSDRVGEVYIMRKH